MNELLKIFYDPIESDRHLFGLDEENYKIQIRGDKNGFLVIYKKEYPGGITYETFKVESLTDIRPTPAEMENGE